MKKIAFIAALSLMTFSTFSQTEKKSWMIGGTGSISSTHEGDIRNSIIDFSPNIGYFFVNNLAGGLNVSINKTVDDGNQYVTTLVNPFLRYYFISTSENKIKLFANANASLGKEDEGAGSSSLNGWGTDIGANFFFNKYVSLETSVGYSSTHAKIEAVKDNTLGFKMGLQIFLWRDNK